MRGLVSYHFVNERWTAYRHPLRDEYTVYRVDEHEVNHKVGAFHLSQRDTGHPALDHVRVLILQQIRAREAESS